MNSSQAREFRGKTVEVAVRQGLHELGLTEEQVDIQVLHPGSRGILGIGAEDAVIQITPLAPATLQPAPVPEIEAVEAAQELTPEPESIAAPVEVTKQAEAEEEIEPIARELLEELLQQLGVQAEVSSYDAEPDPETRETPLVLDVRGNDLGVLIGRRGETLAALQYMVRLMVNRRLRRWTNIVVDVENYKGRRNQQLTQLAQRMAERVKSTGQPVVLEPMPPRERRIIHLTLRDHPDVTTKSVGEGEKRKVTIVSR